MTPNQPKIGMSLDPPSQDQDALLDEALDESFPASDPISVGRREASIDGDAS